MIARRHRSECEREREGLQCRLGSSSSPRPTFSPRFTSSLSLSPPLSSASDSRFFHRRRDFLATAERGNMVGPIASTPFVVEEQLEKRESGPLWLEPLLQTSFFTACSRHGDTNKNECNQYCLDCMGDALCVSCLGAHKDHHVVQIRRSSYHDVIRVSEIQKAIDLSGIQSYIINSARVVFLNGRPQVRQGKGVTNNCEICDRSLMDGFLFCSLGCKLEGILYHHPEMSLLMPPKSAAGCDPMIGECNYLDNMIKRPRSRKPTFTNVHADQDSQDIEDYSDDNYNTFSPFMGMKGEVDLFDHDMNDSEGISPSTPPPTSRRSPKRRKGIPHRAPLGW